MTKRPGSAVLGRWRIIGIEGWDADHVDMLGPGRIQPDRDGGHIEFGVVQVGLDCWHSPTGVHFNFHSSDEGSEVSGDGDADLKPDGSLTGEIRLHQGDEMPFIARRRRTSATC